MTWSSETAHHLKSRRRTFRSAGAFRKILIRVFAVWSLFTSLFVCPADAAELTVSAGIAFKDAFEEMGRVFEAANRGLKIRFNFGASGDLAGQIEADAPVDVFASTSVADMDRLDRKGLVAALSRVNFATNRVVLIRPLEGAAKIRFFKDLKEPAVQRIAIGNPKSVPIGRYAEEVLKHFKVYDAVKSRIVYGENARQVLDYAARGEVDAAIVWFTDARSRAKEVSIAEEAPVGSHGKVVFPVAVVKHSRQIKAASDFIGFLTSAEGKKIIQKHGFSPLSGRE